MFCQEMLAANKLAINHLAKACKLVCLGLYFWNEKPYAERETFFWRLVMTIKNTFK